MYVYGKIHNTYSPPNINIETQLASSHPQEQNTQTHLSITSGYADYHAQCNGGSADLSENIVPVGTADIPLDWTSCFMVGSSGEN